MATDTKHHDPRKLRPAEICLLLNSTPAGEVISERQLLRHRNRAGLRIGDGGTVDLLRYTAWLVQGRHKPPAESAREGVSGASKRKVTAAVVARVQPMWHFSERPNHGLACQIDKPLPGNTLR